MTTLDVPGLQKLLLKYKTEDWAGLNTDDCHWRWKTSARCDLLQTDQVNMSDAAAAHLKHERLKHLPVSSLNQQIKYQHRSDRSTGSL